MTSLAHETRTAGAPRLDLADKIGIAIAVLCVALAVALAVLEITQEAPESLPALIPLDAPHHWSGFTA